MLQVGGSDDEDLQRKQADPYSVFSPRVSWAHTFAQGSQLCPLVRG